MIKTIVLETFGDVKDEEWEMDDREIDEAGIIFVNLTNIKTRETKKGIVKGFSSSGKYIIDVETD